MSAQSASARKTAVLDAAYIALRRAPAASISALYEQMTRIIDINDIPSRSTFTRWLDEFPLDFKRVGGCVTVALRSFVQSEEMNAYILTACDGLPLRLDEDAARRDLWLDDRPGALWDCLRWAVHEGKFQYQRSYDGACWLLIPRANAAA